ncbi:MAG: SGNH/GDSL hydrolase family protein [Prevotellaceae bacterium]|jgi:lysophospholipase L1-like esterase|nr:SGNH/GDSL hydrolase family protein [Prevotellaceae bacterium]
MYRQIIVIIAITALCSLSFAPGKIKWVAIGDSITYLNDHLDETGHRVEKGYLTRVTEKLPDMAYVNKGYNGWTTGGIADKIDELGLEKADVYSVFLGTNDWWRGRPVGLMADYENSTGSGTVYGAFRIIIDKLRSLNDKAPIILITPLQRGDFVYIGNYKNNAYGSYSEKHGQALSDVVKAIQKIARKEKLEVIDLYHKSGINIKNMVRFKRLKDPATGQYKNYPYPAYKKIPFDPENDEYPYPAEVAGMTYDGLHPSDKGNEIIADMLVNKMKSLQIP